MNPYLNDDLVAIAEQARRFATEQVAPGFQLRDRSRLRLDNLASLCRQILRKPPKRRAE